MIDFSNAKVCVTTQRHLDLCDGVCHWLSLSDFGDITEFYSMCGRLFGEDNPDYVFPASIDVPACFIDRKRLCPNIFELQDALKYLTEEQSELFERWCSEIGYDLRTDNVSLLVTEFEDIYGLYPPCGEVPEKAFDFEMPDRTPAQVCGLQPYELEIFTDNYN